MECLARPSDPTRPESPAAPLAMSSMMRTQKPGLCFSWTGEAKELTDDRSVHIAQHYQSHTENCGIDESSSLVIILVPSRE